MLSMMNNVSVFADGFLYDERLLLNYFTVTAATLYIGQVRLTFDSVVNYS